MSRARWRPLALVVALCAGAPGAALAEAAEALEVLLDRALVRSPLLERARAALDAGRARERLARVPYRPQVGLAATYSRSDDPANVLFATLKQGRFTDEVFDGINDPPTTDDWATRLYLRWLATDFGRRRSLLESARAEAERLERLEEAARRDLRFAVSEAYHAVRAGRAELALRKATLDVMTAHERLARDRFEAGTVLRSDVLAASVRVSEAREALVSARHGVERALARLGRAVGEPVPKGAVPSAAALDAPAYRREESEVVRAAREEHPEIAALQAAERSAQHAEGAVSRGHRPRLSVEAGGEWHGDDESPGLDRGSYYLAVMLDVPLSDGGLSRAQRAEAAARRREIAAARREAADALELAARTTHWQALETVARIAIADEAVGAATDAVRIVEERYRAGLVPIIDLLEAERSRTAARVRALEARAQAWTAVAAVERVAGPAAEGVLQS